MIKYVIFYSLKFPFTMSVLEDNRCRGLINRDYNIFALRPSIYYSEYCLARNRDDVCKHSSGLSQGRTWLSWSSSSTRGEYVCRRCLLMAAWLKRVVTRACRTKIDAKWNAQTYTTPSLCALLIYVSLVPAKLNGKLRCSLRVQIILCLQTKIMCFITYILYIFKFINRGGRYFRCARE
jgi:hypothetical protein